MIDPSHEDDQQYQQEYQAMLSIYAQIAAQHPEMIEVLREAIGTSADLIISNRSETIKEFRRLGKELDAFLAACQSGEIDPKSHSRQ